MSDIEPDVRVARVVNHGDSMSMVFQSGAELTLDRAEMNLLGQALTVRAVDTDSTQLSPVHAVLGHEGDAEVQLDVDVLLVSRLLVQAASGGGKSWVLRRLIEQTHGYMPQIVIDPEGEFSTLKQRFRFVLCSEDADADIKLSSMSPAALAIELFRTGLSAVIDLSEYDQEERLRFVGPFIQALVDAPRDIWKACMLVLDEAHLFAPKSGEMSPELKRSRRACMDLTSRGRKRGLCAVMATQRLAKLHNDVAAELKNKVYGTTLLTVDIERAADDLGMSVGEARELLSAFQPGEFVAMGQAFGRGRIVRFKAGPVLTPHGNLFKRVSTASIDDDQYLDLLAEVQTRAKLPEAPTLKDGQVSASIIQLVPKSTLTLPIPDGVRFGSLPAAVRGQIKELALAMMAEPQNRSVQAVHEVMGVPVATLYNWRNAQEQGQPQAA